MLEVVTKEYSVGAADALDLPDKVTSQAARSVVQTNYAGWRCIAGARHS